MATTFTSQGELTFETEMVEVTLGWSPSPNKAWRYTDAQGHEHYWRQGYPTLAHAPQPGLWVLRVRPGRLTRRRRFRDFRPTRQQCRICGEPIRPSLVSPSGFREFAPGRTQWYLDGQPIHPAVAEWIQQSRSRDASRG
jgi:hypothetical protein